MPGLGLVIERAGKNQRARLHAESAREPIDFQLLEPLDSPRLLTITVSPSISSMLATSSDSENEDDVQTDFLKRLRLAAADAAPPAQEQQPAPATSTLPPPDDKATPDESFSPPLSESQADSAQHSTPSTAPRLPPELLLLILSSSELSPTLHPSPLTFQTLRHLLYTSRLCHLCAKEHLYSVLILPRHVREFRRYYDKERNKGWPAIGLTRGFFSALDDVSRLTHTSAGWESTFLRMLHILGPSISHLSIWHNESRALLRDAGQRRGKQRLGSSGPAWSWDEGDTAMDASDSDTDDDGAVSKPASTSTLTASDLAAMKERAKQKMPQWLQREIENSASPSEIAQRHRAHLLPFSDPDNPAANDALQAHLSSTQQRDKRRLKGCRPMALSIVLSLPLFENQQPELFASMIVFSKVQELDVFIPVPAHVAKLLHLLSHLRTSPLKKLKISTTHFTLCIGLPPFTNAQEREIARKEARRKRGVRGEEHDQEVTHPQASMNLANALGAFLHTSTALHDTLLSEFAGKHIDEDGLVYLERLLHATATQHGQTQRSRNGATSTSSDTPVSFAKGKERNRGIRLPEHVAAETRSRLGGLASTLYDPTREEQDQQQVDGLRVRIFQRNQAHYGKLKDRKEDFVKRVMGQGGSIWSQCGMWDDE